MPESRGLRMRGTPKERILQSISKIGDCWLWTKKLNRDGYAELRLSGRYRMAHRVAYEVFVGPVQDGLQLDHLCKVRHCVNPAHLEPVTPRENSLRSDSLWAQNARKVNCKRGHPFDEVNTYNYRGKRTCRACNRLAVRAYEQRKRATGDRP